MPSISPFSTKKSTPKRKLVRVGHDSEEDLVEEKDDGDAEPADATLICQALRMLMIH